jgi:hypothetical protein
MASVARYVLAGLAGAVAGYMGLTVWANLERWQFYSVRSLVTGRSAMSEIVAHPADRWVVIALFAAFIGGGAAVGILAARRSRSQSVSGERSPA